VPTGRMIEGVPRQKWQQNVESSNYGARTRGGAKERAPVSGRERGKERAVQEAKERAAKQDGSAADKLQLVRSLLTIAALK